MKILILTQQYPKKGDLYRNMFVHTRLLAYQTLNRKIEFEVFVLNGESDRYTFEGVSVTEGNQRILESHITNTHFDKIVIHFLTFQMIPVLLKHKEIPQFVWVHGFEALSWKRRLFNAGSIRFAGYILKNYVQLRAFRTYTLQNPDAHFVFVSEWMKQVAEQDTRSTITHKSIIPNGISAVDFPYIEKDPDARYRVLLIRPFSSRKYATDIATHAIEKFARDPDFSKFHFTIAGEGKYFKKDISRIASFSNVSIINKFQSRQEIKRLHHNNGVFLCPTRQDAQGVSMCEAMRSGLVPITSNNTAIPEFVINHKDGYLTSSVDEIVAAFKDLEKNPGKFKAMSLLASKHIQEQCDLDKITKEELSLIISDR